MNDAGWNTGRQSEARTFQRLKLKAHGLHLHLTVRERARRCVKRKDGQETGLMVQKE